jgi:hypothetical protein
MAHGVQGVAAVQPARITVLTSDPRDIAKVAGALKVTIVAG